MCLLISAVIHLLHTMLITKNSPKACPIKEYARTTPPRNSGIPSTSVSASWPTYNGSNTPYHSYKYLLTRYVRESWMPSENQFKSEAWSNTSAPWDRSSRKWGYYNPDSTLWAPSNFDWDDNFHHIRRKTTHPLTRIITPPKNIHPTLHGLRWPRRIRTRPSHCWPHLGCLIINPHIQGVLNGMHMQSVHTLQPPRRPFICYPLNDLRQHHHPKHL